MKNLLRNLMLIGFLFTLPVFIAAQTAGEPNKESSAITSKYDADKDETTIEFKEIEINSDKAKESFLSVSVTFQGKKLTARPDDIIFIISVVSTESYKYPFQMQMKITADNQKLPDVLMLNLDKRKLDEDFLETIGTRMNYKVFKQLADSKTAKLQLDKTTFQIDEKLLSMLREFEKRINP